VSVLGLAIRWDHVEALVGPSYEQIVGRAARRIQHDPYLEAVVSALWREAELHGASTAFFEHGTAAVLTRLRQLAERPMAHASTAPLGQAAFDRVAQFIDAGLASDISVADMATVAGREVSGFARAFKARTGEPPFAWLTRRRMERAMGLLASGRGVTETALEVGYANASKFSAAFRRVSGASPSRWRPEGVSF
jgi:AraC family transcriptional regulator